MSLERLSRSCWLCLWSLFLTYPPSFCIIPIGISIQKFDQISSLQEFFISNVVHSCWDRVNAWLSPCGSDSHWWILFKSFLIHLASSGKALCNQLFSYGEIPFLEGKCLLFSLYCFSEAWVKFLIIALQGMSSFYILFSEHMNLCIPVYFSLWL